MPTFTVTGDVDPFLHVSLRKGETIFCESDAMVMMRGHKTPENQRHDRCIHPSGPHPQHEFCAWKTPKTEGVPKC